MYEDPTFGIMAVLLFITAISLAVFMLLKAQKKKGNRSTIFSFLIGILAGFLATFIALASINSGCCPPLGIVLQGPIFLMMHLWSWFWLHISTAISISRGAYDIFLAGSLLYGFYGAFLAKSDYSKKMTLTLIIFHGLCVAVFMITYYFFRVW